MKAARVSAGQGGEGAVGRSESPWRFLSLQDVAATVSCLQGKPAGPVAQWTAALGVLVADSLPPPPAALPDYPVEFVASSAAEHDTQFTNPSVGQCGGPCGGQCPAGVPLPVHGSHLPAGSVPVVVNPSLGPRVCDLGPVSKGLQARWLVYKMG